MMRHIGPDELALARAVGVLEEHRDDYPARARAERLRDRRNRQALLLMLIVIGLIATVSLMSVIDLAGRVTVLEVIPCLPR